MIVTSFSDFNLPLNEYPKKLKGKALHTWILRNLRNRKRVSIFEICDDIQMARTMGFLEKIGKITTDNKNFSYPYIGVTINE